MRKLAIITTHPIQYNAPMFKIIAERQNIDVHVYYTWGEEVLESKYDPCFGKQIQWDIPLLSGYNFSFVKNTAKDKGSHHFRGIINPTLIEEIQNYHPDAILVYGWSFYSHFKVMKYFKGKIPIYFRGDSHLLNNHNPIKNSIRKLYLKWVYRYIDKAFTVGKNNADYFLWAGVKEEQLIFAPHAVENRRFICTNKSEANLLRKELEIQKDELVFLYAGKLIKRKNVSLLIEAFIDAKIPKSKLVLVGNGILENELKELAKGHKNIKFLDFQNQGSMPAVYEITDVYVLPSAIDTWGLAVNEAMANGCAILLSDKCGCAIDLVENGTNGYTFKNNDKLDLIEKLKEMANADIESFKMKGTEIISGYCYENFVEKIENELNSL